jgi:hypothetical protein
MTRIVTFILGYLYCMCNLLSQSPGDFHVGKIVGKVYDSSRKVVIKSATVAVYLDVVPSSLIQYTLTDEFGDFLIDNLLFDKKYKMIISYSGYEMIEKRFTLSKGVERIDFGRIFAHEQITDLGNVTVTYVPPVRYNKDTLEFNADAFKLSKETVLEDLLKKLPGIILWGDGSITVNGRSVNNILVDGKPFLGGNIKVATNNIPSEIIDKIQVYQQANNNLNFKDSTTHVNVKLKKDRNKGILGKGSIELGGNNYDKLAAISHFSSKTQLSILGSTNNVNRFYNSSKRIIENTLFKSGSVTFDYQPDFRVPGITNATEYGVMLQQEINGNSSLKDYKRLNMEYYGSRFNTNEENSQESLSNSPNFSLTQRSNGKAISNLNKHSLNSRYENAQSGKNSITELRIEQSNRLLTKYRTDSVLENERTFRSENSNTSMSNSKQNVIEIFDHKQINLVSNKKLNFDNKLYIDWNKGNLLFLNRFNSLLFNERLNRTSDFNNYSLRWFSNSGIENINISRSLRLDLGLKILINQNNENSTISNYDSIQSMYIPIGRLTHESRFRELELVPNIKLRAQYDKGLSNRYTKSYQYYINWYSFLFNQSGNSNLQALQFSNRVYRLSPEIGFKFIDFRSNSRLKSLGLKASSFPLKVSRQNLVNLIDSLSIYEYNYANKDLKTPIKDQIELEFSRLPIGRTFTLKYDFKFVASSVRRPIVDSIVQGRSGQTNNYVVNGSSNYSFAFHSSISKMIKSSLNNLQFQFSTSSIYSVFPSFINSDNVNTKQWVNIIKFDIYAYFNKNISGNIGYSLLSNSIDQRGAQLLNKLFNRLTSIKMAIDVNTKWNSYFSSTMFYNSNIASLQSTKPMFLIWNLKYSQRFSKAKIFEASFNAYDILRSNRSITYSNSKNGLVLTNQNVLQQYFSFGVSYFPRFFKRNSEE